MANKVQGTERWSEVVQVMVSEETKASLVEQATLAGKSQSTLARELLVEGLERLEKAA